MSGDRYPSVSERITWTPGFRVATDKAVLGTLSTFADFKTGLHASMALDTLIHRAKMPRRTVIRSLRRLERDGWVTARRRHRRPTVYNIAVERLATHWMEAKLVHDATALSATDGTQEAVLSAPGGTPSPVRTDPQLDPQTTALRAAIGHEPEAQTTTKELEVKVEATQLTLGPYDVSPGSQGTTPHEASGDVWIAILQRIEVRMNRHSFYTWFRPTTLVHDDGLVIQVAGPTVNGELHVSWIQKHYGEILRQAVDEVRPGARVEFVEADLQKARA